MMLVIPEDGSTGSSRIYEEKDEERRRSTCVGGQPEMGNDRQLGETIVPKLKRSSAYWSLLVEITGRPRLWGVLTSSDCASGLERGYINNWTDLFEIASRGRLQRVG
jgi:hypothetical protein